LTKKTLDLCLEFWQSEKYHLSNARRTISKPVNIILTEIITKIAKYLIPYSIALAKALPFVQIVGTTATIGEIPFPLKKMVAMLTAAYGVHDKNQTSNIENAILASFSSI